MLERNNELLEEILAAPSKSPRLHGSEMTRGLIPGHQIIHKFGADIDITANYLPVAQGGMYPTPQPAGAVQLRIAAGNVNDDVGGTGARAVHLQGLDISGDFLEQTIHTNGTSAGAVSEVAFLRLFRAWVSSSGTYASAGGGSHAAAIIIESGASATWAIIDATGFPKGQTEIAAYSVPNGFEAVIKSIIMTTDGLKPVDFALFQRRDILQAAPPYAARRLFFEAFGVEGSLTLAPESPWGPFPAQTDLGWLAKGATSPDVTADMEIALYDVRQGRHP